MDKLIRLKKNQINPVKFTELVKCLYHNGVIIFPTDTVYGIGCNAFSPTAIKRIYKIKSRTLHKPLILLASQFRQVSCFIADVPPITNKLIKRFWPGGLTLIFKCSPLGMMVTGGKPTIGVRIPANKVLLELIIRLAVPIASTSANFSTQPAVCKVSDLPVKIRTQVDYILDAGTTLHRKESTVLDLSHFPYTLVRKGVVDTSVLNRILI